MKPSYLVAPLAILCLLPAIQGQTDSPDTAATLRINSRAVLVDVVVTDRNGNPVKGLAKDSFSVKEQGKPQNVSYFEEHLGLTTKQAEGMSFPQLPPDVFSNYSPIGAPAAVNILLLDALNTPVADQMYLRKAAEHYLKTLKPGSRLAIFTLSLRLRVVQGFADDPAVLAKALGYRKNDKAEPTVLIQSPEEGNAQDTVVGLMNEQLGAGPGGTTSAAPAAMIQAFQQFMQETQYAQTADREYRTTQALQQLASYLASFPGRKNLIWMSGAFPLDIFGLTDMRFDDSTRKTVSLLAASRVALYPVDVRGVWTHSLYTAENTQNQTVTTAAQMMGPAVGFQPSTADSSATVTGAAAATVTTGGFAQAVMSQSAANNSSNAAMDMVAEQTGGKAFYNGNDLSGIINKVVAGSSDFYTVSYTPTNANMDGAFRKIDVSVAGGKYILSYRHGYFAREEALPGAAQTAQRRAIEQATTHPDVDPLKPFMDFGLPQTEQILYKVGLQPTVGKLDSAAATNPEAKAPASRLGVDFSVDLKDLNLPLDPADGLHKGMLNLSMILYNKYGDIVSRKDHLIALNIKPDIWSAFQQTGVQLHGEIDVPNKEQYWLRTGVYDQSTRKVGTMEVPLSSVQLMQASTQHGTPTKP